MKKFENLVRGKYIETCEWVEGYYCGVTCDTPFSKARTSSQIILMDCCWAEVIPETVGRFTGKTDIKNKKIFEGDIINASNDVMCHIGIVRYGEYKFPWGDEHNLHIGFYVDFLNNNTLRNDLGYWLKYIEVIGNIYDNIELIGDDEA